jgi:hypothetical protein
MQNAPSFSRARGIALNNFLLALALISSEAWGHASSDAFLRVSSGNQGSTIELSVSLLDLHRRFGIDGDQDAKVTWGELRGQEDAIRSYLNQRLIIRSEGRPCSLDPPPLR